MHDGTQDEIISGAEVSYVKLAPLFGIRVRFGRRQHLVEQWFVGDLGGEAESTTKNFLVVRSEGERTVQRPIDARRPQVVIRPKTASQLARIFW